MSRGPRLSRAAEATVREGDGRLCDAMRGANILFLALSVICGQDVRRGNRRHNFTKD